MEQEEANGCPSAEVSKQKIEHWSLTHSRQSVSHNPPTELALTMWSPPSHGFIKCNVDAALFADKKLINMGFVIRDHSRRFLAAKAGCGNGPMDAMVVKALSCREALQWLKKNSYKKVLIETDSLLLVMTVNRFGNYISPLGLIIQDCKDLLQAITSSSLIFVHQRTSSCTCQRCWFSVWSKRVGWLPSSKPPGCNFKRDELMKSNLFFWKKKKASIHFAFDYFVFVETRACDLLNIHPFYHFSDASKDLSFFTKKQKRTYRF